MGQSILVVDDEVDFLDSVRRGLLSAGYKNIIMEKDGTAAAARFAEGECSIDLALIDITMPGMDGTALLQQIKALSPATECIMISARNEARTAVECLKRGAYDYLVKPIVRDDLISAIKRALERKTLLAVLDVVKKDKVDDFACPEAFAPIATRSPKTLKVLKEAELHARSDVPVIITGESGTGKELLAKAIHMASPRSRFPFTPINMAALSGNLIDAEFFGHAKGAFTGADRDRMGYLEFTDRGTLFLDEVGDLPLEFQGKLLRSLQDGEYLKLGTNQPRKTDVRFIAATNRDLEHLMAKGLFRKDLYYRLRGAWLHLPPLRERREDIPLLIDKFLEEYRGDSCKSSVDEDAMARLVSFDYPGNIRQLRAVIQATVNLAQGKSLSAHILPEYLKGPKKAEKGKETFPEGEAVPLAAAEKTHILKTYAYTGNNKAQTAKLLDIGLNTLRRKLESYDLD